ncbi:MAG TPA: DUF488 family protein [Candidatus Dormibacteraeota bacterium]|nr:DUF488 family protein [Candidatus Dormibacteraeota bacterium]
MTEIRLRRVYDRVLPQDGTRVLVDRLWPRGIAKAAAHLDEWLRTVAPSDELRRWYNHVPERFPEFRERYLTELSSPEWAVAVAHLRELARSGTLTLLTSTRDADHSQARVLLELLTGVQVPPEEGGDPACWQRRVCPNCGALADSDPPTICEECHQEFAG